MNATQVASRKVSARKTRTAQILDMAIRISEDESSHKLDNFLSLKQYGSPLSIPPLDQITVCSDDSGSVSSLSSHEDFEGPVTVSTSKGRRSIFNTYWKNHEKEQTGLETPQTSLTWDQASSSSSLNTYERTLTKSEVCAQKAPISPHCRRSIFNKKCFSESKIEPMTLMRLATREPPVRKAQSDSALQRPKPRESCLRQARFSGSGERRISTSSSVSVTFKSQVDVRVFETPVEKFAEKGWSAWFA